MNDYDVVVVGGRVAGASTAMLLSRAGLRVACRRALAARCRHRLHACVDARRGPPALSLGRAPDLVSAEHPARFAASPSTTPTVRRPAVTLRPTPGVDALYAPRRHLLDRVLVDAATASGADALHETPVVGLLRDDDGRVHGVRVPGADGHDVSIRAGLTVGADGLGSLVAREVGARFLTRGQAASAILYRYVDQVPSTGYVWAYGAGTAAGLIPTNGGETCVFVSTTPARMRRLRREGAESAFQNLLDAAPAPLRRRRTSGWGGRAPAWLAWGARTHPSLVRPGVGPGR